MTSEIREPFHPMLFDPRYWRERIASLGGPSAGRLVLPRPELERPGIEALEVFVRGHDGARLHALLAHCPLASPSGRLLLRWPSNVGVEDLDLEEVGVGHVDLFLFRDPLRRLESRVLDFLALFCAAKSLPALDCRNLVVEVQDEHRVPEEYRIGKILLDLGWCEGVGTSRMEDSGA